MSLSETDPQSLVEASIEDLQKALSTGSLTCVELVSKLLHRISTYDCRGLALNAIPLINPDVFAEAVASDERRAKGKVNGLLDGIPYTIKDSYMVKGMTVACGSKAFEDLISGEDAFVVAKLREAGAILIGKTNMPPIAAGGLQGVYGRAESPYNLDYLAAAFASGSSVGSAVATTASFASFSLGGETVSSGRSPASNNGLVAYTPSRGGISIRGDWPLYPTCDVVVPYTRTVDDLLILLDIISGEDKLTSGDFWRDQPFIKIPNPWEQKPDSLQEISTTASLEGLRIAVPGMYVGINQSLDGAPVYTSPLVKVLWQQAKADLERLGAHITLVSSFPMVEQYENLSSVAPTETPTTSILPKGWHGTERSALIAHAWESFLITNNDPKLSSLSDVWYGDIYPSFPPDDPQLRWTEPANRIQYEKLAAYAKLHHESEQDIYGVPQLSEALNALETMRKTYLEDWLVVNNFDCVVFPASGDVAATDADINHDSAEHAWRNGVRYSNGNRALRHLGVPTVTVPMGTMQEKGMPVGLTFCGRGGDDVNLLRWSKAYEAGTKMRQSPNLTPALLTDEFRKNSHDLDVRASVPKLFIENCVSSDPQRSTDGMLEIRVDGYFTIENGTAGMTSSKEPVLEIFIDAASIPVKVTRGREAKDNDTAGLSYSFRCQASVPAPPQRKDRRPVASKEKVARDSTMIVVLVRDGVDGRPSGFLKLL